MAADRNDEEVFQLGIRRNPAAWFENFGVIQRKGGALAGFPDLKANFMQLKIAEVVEWCQVNRVPCRIISLKPRQKGSSTFYVAVGHRHLANQPRRGCIVGGAHEQGEKLFKMLRLYAEHDGFMAQRAKVLDRHATYPNGSTCTRITAANVNSGTGGTFEVLICTEVAKWAEEGVANAAEFLSNLLKTVPSTEGAEETIIVLESTANGASGDFYDRYQKAVTFAELKAGQRGHYVKLFFPWFMFPDSRLTPAAEGLVSVEDLTPRERELAALHKLDLAQVAWMRWAIREECKGDFDIFCQDYPFDDQSAFLTSGRRRFNVSCVAKMKAGALSYPPEFGMFEEQGDGVLFRPAPPDEARVMRWEQPRDGCAYLVSVDVMTGASQTGGDDPDNHAPLVWRRGFFEHGRGWTPPRLVCRLIGDWRTWERERKCELRWDIDVLEEQVWRMSRYYGNCLIVPEVNMDRGLIELLKLRGANIYQREIFNRREHTVDKALGWHTDPRTREMAVECLARHIREHGRENGGVDIHDPILLAELESFVVKENGRSEAMSGKHDDNVLSAAIGLITLDAATGYRQPARERRLAGRMGNFDEGNPRAARAQYW
ncbi:MAG: hypothetical protein LBK60_03185 [Verrucomicrobiales bacterium]|jgi:hypothetical protein|nr:hypothetical protein [Verrucomicrobiales bacterium]